MRRLFTCAAILGWILCAAPAGAQITIVDYQSNSGDNSVIVNVPNLTNATLMIFHVVSSIGIGNVGPPTITGGGWTQFVSTCYTPLYEEQDLYYRFPSSEPSSYTLSANGGSGNAFIAGTIASYSGTPTSGNPIDVTGSCDTTVTADTITALGVTPNVLGDMWVAAFATAGGPISAGPGSPFRLIYNLSDYDSTGYSAAEYETLLSNTNPTGNATATTTSVPGAGISYLILPASASPTPTATSTPTASPTPAPGRMGVRLGIIQPQ